MKDLQKEDPLLGRFLAMQISHLVAPLFGVLAGIGFSKGWTAIAGLATLGAILVVSLPPLLDRKWNLLLPALVGVLSGVVYSFLTNEIGFHVFLVTAYGLQVLVLVLQAVNERRQDRIGSERT